MTRKTTRPEEQSIAALLAPDILDLLETEPSAVAAETEELHPADLADVAERLPRSQIPVFLAALPVARAAAALEYLAEERRTEMLEAMSPEQAALLVAQMTPDDRADTLEEIDEEHAEDIVEAMPGPARRETEQLLAFEPDTAGGLMTTQFVSVTETETVEAALSQVREMARAGRREAMNTVYTLDAAGALKGVLSLRELLAAPEGARMADVAWTEVRTVAPTADREEVARVTQEYDLVAVPVVDDRDRVLGVVTVDDVIDAIQQEQTEDVQKLGGMQALEEPYIQMGFWSMIQKRAPWLIVLLLGGMFTTTALGYYEDELGKAMVLAMFLPLIISAGGNSGSQGTSLIIRSLALREVGLGDWKRVAVRELPAGLTLGGILAVIGFFRIELWQRMWDSKVRIGTLPIGFDYGEHHTLVALTVAISLIGVVAFGALVGSMLPFFLRKVGFDPANASAPFVATLVDVTGVVIFFSVALVLLRGTLL